MEHLFQYSASMIRAVQTGFKRYLREGINWGNRLIVIVGARGAGKTTLILQYIKEHFSDKHEEVLYVSLDDLFFSKNNLVEFAGDFLKRGGKHLFLDEVHKYKNWSTEIKNCYDYFPDLKIVVTGSSALDIHKGRADLSRRAMVYRLNGLSFREYIELKYGITFPVFELQALLVNPSKPIDLILSKIRPIKYFEEYLRWGYYPFFTEGKEEYPIRIKQIVNHILEVDLPSVENIDFNAVHHLRTLISVISEIAPFKPNIIKLSHQLGISRETLLRYLYLLESADLVSLLKSGTKGISRMNKPEKVYLNNTNLSFALAYDQVNTGSIRETFFNNQLNVRHKVLYTPAGDFAVDDIYTFEIGGKNKKHKQVKGIEKAFFAADNIEYSHNNMIPLWLFGFLY